MTKFLPYGRHSIDEQDIEAVAGVLRSNWLTTGPEVERFEADLAKAVGARFAVACSSGTAGLHLAALALGLGPGDAVVVPAITFLATANAFRYVGAEVVFSDVDADTGLMQAQHLEDVLGRVPEGSEVKAVCPVFLNGQCFDPAAIRAIADTHGLKVIEDACHAIGATYAGDRRVGGALDADISVFSFHPVKSIAMGEGGALTGQDEAIEKSLRVLRNHGMVRDCDSFAAPELALARDGGQNPWYYELQELGFNYRASDIHCALGRSQLRKLDRFVERRRALAALYDERLSGLSPLVRTVGRVQSCNPAWHLYVVLIEFDKLGIDRGMLMRRLKEKGIGTQVHYIPVPWQPYYRRRYGMPELPGVARYYERCLSLPLYPELDEGDIDYIANSLEAIVRSG